MSVPFEDILSDGPPRDGIPPIDDPTFVTAARVTDVADREPVIQFGIGADVRAYPLRVLTWHEIANDVVGDRPVAVTYCPLCNAAIVFDRTLDGRVAYEDPRTLRDRRSVDGADEAFGGMTSALERLTVRAASE